MKGIELFIGNAGKEADRVFFGREDEDKGQTSNGHPASTCGEGGRIAIVDFFGVRPVVGALAEGHGHEEDEAESSC